MTPVINNLNEAVREKNSLLLFGISYIDTFGREWTVTKALKGNHTLKSIVYYFV